MNYLEFEKPLAEIEGKAEELRAMARGSSGMDVSAEAEALDRKAEQMLKDFYKGLTAWQKCQVARHPDRPHCKSYIDALFTEYTALAGDRNFADDHAVMGGLARFNDQPVVVIGHEKGHDTKSRIERNFGMARPEGYRKAIRLMDMADKFRLPVITLVDTPGAYPGKGAEERGQSEAIARSTERSLAHRRAGDRRHHRRGWLGRRGGLRHGQPHRHAGAFDLFGDLARGLRLDPLEGQRKDARGRRGAAADRAGPAEAGRHRPHRAGAFGRRAAGGQGNHRRRGHGPFRRC